MSNLIEIERKFLLKDNRWLLYATGHRDIIQHYLVNDGTKCMRIRREIFSNSTLRYTLTIKSSNAGCSRVEVEKEITESEFKVLAGLPNYGSIIKRRFFVPFQGEKWEIDVFQDGRVIAEIEFRSDLSEISEESEEEFYDHLPDWIGEEVTDKKEYYNAEMAN
jgi:CYTH domain-containing protein